MSDETRTPLADTLGLLPDPFDQDSRLDALEVDFEQEHYGSTGAHGAITCDSMTARAATNRLPVTGTLEFLRGAWLFDAVGNSSHVIGLRPIQWTGRQDNYSPPGLADAFIVEVDTDADRSITGIARAARQKRLLIFGNRGNFTVTLEHNDSNSLYHNRFGCPNSVDLVIGSNEYVWLYYDVGSEIWRVISVL